MRRSYSTVFFLLLIASFPTTAQDLLESRRSSYYTMIYKISNEQAKMLYKDIWQVDTTLLNNLHDYFPTDSTYRKELPIGHYVFVKTVEGNLKCELHSVNNLTISVLNNHRDLMMIFHDLNGHEIEKVKVEVRSRTVPFQHDIKAYRLGKSNKRGIVAAEYRGHTSYFEIQRSYNNTFVVRTVRKLSRTFPVNHLISPVFYLINNTRRVINGGWPSPPGIYYRFGRIFQPKPNDGYIILNKPKYRPNDTLKLKAIVTTKRGKTTGRSAVVYLSKSYPDPFSKKIATVDSYEKGSYKFEFILNDRMNLRLDQNYSIEIKNKKGHDLLTASFAFEEYVLKNNNYFVRSEQPTKLKAPILYLKGEDSNSMPLFDVTADILLTPKKVKQFYQSRSFVPDTLWSFQLKLDALGETKVSIPDSVLPDLSMEYEAIVSFRNAENERTVKTLSLQHEARPFPIKMELVNDSLKITQLNLARPLTVPIVLSNMSTSGNIVEKAIVLPYSEQVESTLEGYAVSYTSGGKTFKDHIDLADLPDQLQISSNRSTDSLFIVAENPRRIPFRYFLFENKALIECSLAESLVIKKKTRGSSSYSLSMQYIWAGTPQTRDYNIGFEEKKLNITIDHPSIVYPGQQASFKINVKDVRGNPISNVDLTAVAVTRKFATDFVESVPSFSKKKEQRSIFNEFHLGHTNTSVSKWIQWAYWKNVLGLDSIVFYQFLFPKDGYFEHRSKAASSQFAPFVVRNGDTKSIQVIYVDGIPVYYEGVDNHEPYSFHVTPGVHTVALRLHSNLITITNVKVEASQKLIFSIDLKNLPSNCTQQEMPYKFTKEEITKLSRFFMIIKGPQNETEPFLQQGNLYRLMAKRGNSYRYPFDEQLVGPFHPGLMTYGNGQFEHNFTYEPFQTYDFQINQTKLRYTRIEDQLKKGFRWSFDIPSLKDQALTIDSIKEYWKSRAKKTAVRFARFPSFESMSKRIGRLTIADFSPGPDSSNIHAIFVVDVKNPDNYTIVTKEVINLPFEPGNYHAIIILDNAHYLRVDSIDLRAYGNNHISLQAMEQHEPDTLSAYVLRMLDKWSKEQNYVQPDRQFELQKVRELFYRESSIQYNFDHSVSGTVVSAEDGSPLPGVNVMVRGTAIGTVTDANGNYTLGCPSNATLIFSFIGLATQEVAVANRSIADLTMALDVTQLNEVVVVGYSSQVRRSLTGTVATMLYGRVAGVQATDARLIVQDSVQLLIRGAATLKASGDPLLILDGRVVNRWEIDPGTITAMLTMKNEEAVRLYGSRASNGVILLSTKPAMTRENLKKESRLVIPTPALENTPGNSLRKNFRDYAFWKPTLITNQHGQVEFKATFPDDITGWDVHILGMKKRYTGQTTSRVNSLKPLVAQIAQPLFLIEGDSSKAIGKITNYTPEQIDLERTIKLSDKEPDKSHLTIKDSRIDSISLTTNNTDSISVLYTVSHKDYTDGELRKLPVFRAGVKESNGYFVSLDNDTTFTLNFENKDANVKIFAQSDALDVFIDEVAYLKTYPYECNEQLASRLTALLLEKKICAYTMTSFKDEREISRVVRKLSGNQNQDGSWSWWGKSDGNIWVTLHVAKSLILAKKEGYPVAVDFEAIINNLEVNMANTISKLRLEIQAYLLEQGEKLQIKGVVDDLTNSRTASLHDKLLAQRIRQLAGETPDWQWINSLRSRTLKGNYYWGEDDQSNVFDNAVVNTLLVYRMKEKENPSSKELVKLRNYFLEKRQRNWRNTHESSLILETLLPALLRERTSEIKPVLHLSGLIDKKIVQFPFEQTVTSGTLTIKKTGQLPVYFTAYQETWNKNPEKSEKDFIVRTHFEDSPKKLNSGKPINLIIDVEVKNDAEYVMIEVPIPAGCNYSIKSQPRTNGEVHREYYNHKANIYCQYLKKGKYTYTVSLLPRYTGSYTINPAVVECMYFPTLFGREKMKRVAIK